VDPTTTHTIGEGGAASWATPDVNTPEAARLDPWLPVQVVQVWGDWARVRCENGWETWTDGRTLVRAAPAAGAPAATAPPRPAAADAPTWPAAGSGPAEAHAPGPWTPAAQGPAPATPVAPAAAAAAPATWAPTPTPAPGPATWAPTPTSAPAPGPATWAPAPGPSGAPGYASGPGYAPAAAPPVADVWKWLGPAGAGLALVGGFLPWLEAGPLSANAWDIRLVALVNESANNSGPWAGMAVLLAAVGALCAFLRPPGIVVALGGALACVPTGFMMLRWMQDDFAGAQLGAGAPIAFVGTLLVLATGCKLTAEDLRRNAT
jgi:hypothetical protein